MRVHRPRDLSPPEIGFTPRPAVAWLNPGLLLGAAVRVLLAYLLGSYLDKRELQAALPGRTHTHDAQELWLDYTADVGDGFDATYSVAYLLGRPTLDIEQAGLLPRASVLVLGGDQVYPTASAHEYENRWKGPYRAALPVAAGDSPTLYALPGNHDWYDGLTSFLRLFAQGNSVGGYRTRQTRSYFALQLPHRWWLFAVDTQFDTYIDEPQLEYFHQAADTLDSADRVILCAARPAWVMTEHLPEAYNSLDYFIRTVIEPTGADVPLLLAGDNHHYLRYTGSPLPGRERHLVTCGGGGAYLVGTAHLPEEVTVPPPATVTRAASDPVTYRRQAGYPDAATSRRLDWTVLTRLPRRNPGFVAMTGLLQTLLMLAILSLDAGQWLNLAVAATVATVTAGTVAFAVLLGQRSRKHWAAGLLHAVPHVVLGVAGAAVWSSLPLANLPPPWSTLLVFLVYLPVAGVLDTLLICGYLLVARYAGVNVNELYAGLGRDDYKSFLRLHIAPDGSLTIYPVAVDDVCRRWRAKPEAPPEAPWIVPEQPLHPRLAEPPVTIR